MDSTEKTLVKEVNKAADKLAKIKAVGTPEHIAATAALAVASQQLKDYRARHKSED